MRLTTHLLASRAQAEDQAPRLPSGFTTTALPQGPSVPHATHLLPGPHVPMPLDHFCMLFISSSPQNLPFFLELMTLLPICEEMKTIMGGLPQIMSSVPQGVVPSSSCLGEFLPFTCCQIPQFSPAEFIFQSPLDHYYWFPNMLPFLLSVRLSWGHTLQLAPSPSFAPMTADFENVVYPCCPSLTVTSLLSSLDPSQAFLPQSTDTVASKVAMTSQYPPS